MTQRQNPVAKFAFVSGAKAKVFRDRKKEIKSGKSKHKDQSWNAK